MNAVIEWCLEDEAIAKYVFNSPPPSLRFARYTDCLFALPSEIRDSGPDMAAAQQKLP